MKSYMVFAHSNAKAFRGGIDEPMDVTITRQVCVSNNFNKL